MLILQVQVFSYFGCAKKRKVAVMLVDIHKVTDNVTISNSACHEEHGMLKQAPPKQGQIQAAVQAGLQAPLLI